MPTKHKNLKSKNSNKTQNRSGLANFLLALTLVPLAVGAALLIAWALDLETFGNPERLPPVAFFFLTLGFCASNALQKRWVLTTGWSLLGIASLILWISTHTSLLIASFILGTAGLIFLGFEFFKRIATQDKQKDSR